MHIGVPEFRRQPHRTQGMFARLHQASVAFVSNGGDLDADILSAFVADDQVSIAGEVVVQTSLGKTDAGGVSVLLSNHPNHRVAGRLP